MLFLNKFYWNIALLCLLISDSPDNKKFVKDVLRINNLDKIKIKIDFIKRNYANYNDNFALRLVRDIDAKSEYSLKEFTEIINDKFYTPFSVFKYLYLAYTPKDAKIIDGIIIEFSEGLTVADLSEGEKKLLLIKGALEFAGQEDSIFILDEPDSHIHINNKEQITNCFKDYLHNRQIIITTHSPTLTQCVKDENVYMMTKGKIEHRTRQEIIEEVTGDFWNKQQQNSFLSSNKPIQLFVEGIHDKAHIANSYKLLESEYNELNFDIYSLGGEDKIHGFINGLYEANLKEDKVYIAIYDNDNAGDKAFTKSGYLPLQPLNEFRKLKEDKIKHNNFFACKLPKPDNHDEDCTIENLLDATLYEQAYREAFENRIGNFEGKSIEAINENIKKDSKNILSEKSGKLTNKEDFKHFRKLFDLIREIARYSSDHKIVSPIDKTPVSKKKLEPQITSTSKISAKENHLAYWTAFKEFIAQQKVSFNVQKPQAQHWTNITIGKSDFRLALLANTQKNWIGVQLICLGKNALNDFHKLKDEFELDASSNLSNDLEWKENNGKREHHINLVFSDKNPFDKADWMNQHQILSEWTEKFYNYFKDKVKNLVEARLNSDIE